MTTTLVLTPDPSGPSVLVEVTGAPAGPVVVTRYDVNGAGMVRLLDGQEPISGALTITDYEPALVGSLRYDVTQAGATLTTATTTLDGTVGQPWLHVPVLPQNRAELVSVLGVTSARPSATTVHEVVGREDPLPTGGVLRMRTGNMRVWAPDYPAARALEALAHAGEVLMFRQPDHAGLDMYLTATAANTTAETQTQGGWRWIVEFEYVECGSPDAPLLGSIGWNFDAMAQFGTFNDVTAAFADFNDLVVGP